MPHYKMRHDTRMRYEHTLDVLTWSPIGLEVVNERPREDWLPLMEDLLHRCSQEDPPIKVPFTAPELVDAIYSYRYIVYGIPHDDDQPVKLRKVT